MTTILNDDSDLLASLQDFLKAQQEWIEALERIWPIELALPPEKVRPWKVRFANAMCWVIRLIAPPIDIRLRVVSRKQINVDQKERLP